MPLRLRGMMVSGLVDRKAPNVIGEAAFAASSILSSCG
jgi:hypothetical protein